MKRRKSTMTPRKRKVVLSAEQLTALAPVESFSNGAIISERAPSLLNYGLAPKAYYIAVSVHGFGIDQSAAMAIRLAQTEVPADSEEAQLLIYRSDALVEPIDFEKGGPIWELGVKPSLVGLTTTHQGFRERPRL